MEMLNNQLFYVALGVQLLALVYYYIEEMILQPYAEAHSTMLAWRRKYYELELASREQRLQDARALAAHVKSDLLLQINELPEQEAMQLLARLDVQFKKLMHQ